MTTPTPKQLRILRYINEHSKHLIQSPTHEEIAHGLQYKKRNNIIPLVVKLIRDGFLERGKYAYRNLIVTKKGKEVLNNEL